MSLVTEKASTMPSDDNPVISQLDLGEPPQEYLDYAKRELGEDAETRCQVLADFRDLIYERGECMPHRTDDAFLLKFLRAKRFSVRHAHRMLVNYCEFKEDNPEYFENVSITDLKRVGQSNIIAVPPYRDQAGHRILLYRIGLWNPEEFTIVEMIQATMLILELAILEQKAQIMGGVCIFDLADLTMQQIWYMTPKLAKQMFQIMVTSFPLRVEAVHIINQPWIFESVFNLFKPFMNEKMRQRLFIHGSNMESLHEHMSPKYLPERYGGVHPDYNYNDWIHWFLATEKICTEMRSLGYLTDDKEKKRKSDI